MKIHEYQAKEILKQYGIPVPRGRVAHSAAEAQDMAEEIGGPVVIKAQIHAGGRGKGGGIKRAETPSEANVLAGKMIGSVLVTPQTGPEGRKVRRALVEEAVEVERELYLGMVLDRSQSKESIMASKAGGMEIEEVAAQMPEKILKETIDPAAGLQPFQARRLAFGLGMEGKLVREMTQLILSLCTTYERSDCSLAEINPLVVTRSGRLLALDAKLNLDDNARYRHPEIAKLRDLDEEDPLEVEATRYNLNYIRLSGNIGCMVNGAGLAMATMDLIQLAGGEPANFLDVGGGASSETVENGFRIILSDENVKAVLINIFGGIVRCDRVAEGVVEALSKIEVNVPVVVRLEGTNAQEAGEILRRSGLNFIVARGLKEAAEKAVASGDRQ